MNMILNKDILLKKDMNKNILKTKLKKSEICLRTCHKNLESKIPKYPESQQSSCRATLASSTTNYLFALLEQYNTPFIDFTRTFT
jgi:hypothetical protein